MQQKRSNLTVRILNLRKIKLLRFCCIAAKHYDLGLLTILRQVSVHMLLCFST